MRRGLATLLTALIVILIVAPYTPRSSGLDGSYVEYEVRLVPPSYNSTVVVRVHVGEPRWSFWVAVPKDWRSSTLRVVGGRLVRYSVRSLVYGGEENPFYNNLTVYGEGRSLVLLSYTHPYTLLVSGRSGLFLSPLIMHSGYLADYIYVYIPIRGVNIKEASVYPYKVESNSTYTVMRFNRVSGGRVSMILTFHSSVAGDVEVRYREFVFRTPQIYRKCAEETLRQIYAVYDSNYTWLFGFRMNSMVFHFFVPDSLNMLGVGGYTPYLGGSLGDIYINVLYLRGVEGQLKLIGLHELVHRMLFKAGISPNPLLWVHEGFAEYISTTLTKSLPAGRMRVKDLLTVAESLHGELGFVEDWRPGMKVSDVGRYYAASFMVIYSVGRDYGGFRLYHKFFSLLKTHRVSDTRSFVSTLSIAAGHNLTAMFWNWGFRVGPPQYPAIIRRAVRKADGLPWWLQPLSVVSKWLAKTAVKSYDAGYESRAALYASLSLALSEHPYLFEALFLLLITLLVVGIYLLLRGGRGAAAGGEAAAEAGESPQGLGPVPPPQL